MKGAHKPSVECPICETQTTVSTQCPMCKTHATINVPLAGYEKWLLKKALIQDALPKLSSLEREQLITGICELCWEKYINTENGN